MGYGPGIKAQREYAMNEHSYTIEFEGVSAAEANRYADDLRNVLLNATPAITIERHRADQYAQDFGATLVMILGTPVAVIVARAFRDWLQRRNSPHLTVVVKTKKADGSVEEVRIANALAQDADKLVQELLQRER
jgi:hypothetical protein